MGIPAKFNPHSEPAAGQPRQSDSGGTGIMVCFQSDTTNRIYEVGPNAPTARQYEGAVRNSGALESALRYWRCAEMGPPLRGNSAGESIYDLADVELYLRTNKRLPPCRHMEAKAMVLHKRSGIYHTHFPSDGKRHLESTTTHRCSTCAATAAGKIGFWEVGSKIVQLPCDGFIVTPIVFRLQRLARLILCETGPMQNAEQTCDDHS
jgi:hypothetical protein